MKKYFLYFQKKDNSPVKHISGLRYGYVENVENGEIYLGNKKYAYPLDAESDARDLLYITKHTESLLEYNFKIILDRGVTVHLN